MPSRETTSTSSQKENKKNTKGSTERTNLKWIVSESTRKREGGRSKITWLSRGEAKG